LKAEPQNFDARAGLAAVQLLSGNEKAGLKNLDLILAQDPENSSVAALRKMYEVKERYKARMPASQK
jgi:hypothetical protein